MLFYPNEKLALFIGRLRLISSTYIGLVGPTVFSSAAQGAPCWTGANDRPRQRAVITPSPRAR